MSNALNFNPEHYHHLIKCLDNGQISDWNEYVDSISGQICLEKADLSGDELNEANLQGANLRKATLEHTKFYKVYLQGSYLQNANLKFSYLVKANLQWANLEGADIRGASIQEAKLSHAKLRKAQLQWSDLRNADLRKANIQEAKLLRAMFQEADLRDADLRNSNLRKANFQNAKLQGVKLQGTILLEPIISKSGKPYTAEYKYEDHIDGKPQGNEYLNDNYQGVNFQEADFQGTDLSEVDLTGCNLTDADLSGSKLIGTNLSNSIITGVSLYGTSRDDWIIRGIQCDYIYWDKDKKKRTPKERDFKPGEFEDLYESLPEITYYFSDEFSPVTPLIMDKVVKSIREEKPEFELSLDSFHSRGIPHAIFTVLNKEYSEEALEKISKGYEMTIHKLESKVEILREIITGAIEKPQLIQAERIDHIGHTFGNVDGKKDINIVSDHGELTIAKK